MPLDWSSSPEPVMPERFTLFRKDIDMEKMRALREAEDRYFGPIVKSSALDISTDISQSQPTTTPESQRLSPVVPNAPIKQRKAMKKIDLRPKKLDYTEPEVEPQNSVDSGILSRPPSAQLIKKFSRSKNSKAKGEPINKRNVKKSVQSCDKENIENIASKNQIDEGESSNLGKNRRGKNLTKLSVLPIRSQLEESSSDGSDTSDSGSDDRQKWLELHQDNGTWIECCSKTCKKWRFTEEYSDPLDVPEKWYCHMNIDRDFASCDMPEEKIPSKVNKRLVENKYCRGSLVWARLDGFPWWPAMVENCPTTLLYYELKESSIVPIKYHVLFFNTTKGDRAWIREKDLKSFLQNPRSNVVKKTTFRGINYNEKLDVACHSAWQTVPFSNVERAERFGLVARSFEKNRTMSTNSRRTAQKRGSTTSDESIKPRSSENQRTKRVRTESDENSNSRPSENLLPKNKRTEFVEKELAKNSKAGPSTSIKYNVGDIVWARPKGYPWWPAIIDVCPIANLHYGVRKFTNIPNKYHVVYFNEDKFETDWRSDRDVKDFASNPRRTVVKKTKFREIDFLEELDDACDLAREAELLSHEERLKRYGVAARSFPIAGKKNQSVKKPKKQKSSNFESEPESSSVGTKKAWEELMEASRALYSPIDNEKSQDCFFNGDESTEKNDECSNEIEQNLISNESDIRNDEPSTSGLDNRRRPFESFDKTRLSSPSKCSDELIDFEVSSSKIKSLYIPLIRNDEAIKSKSEQSETINDRFCMDSTRCYGNNNESSTDENYREYFESSQMTSSCDFDDESSLIVDIHENGSEPSRLESGDSQHFFSDDSAIQVICDNRMNRHSGEGHKTLGPHFVDFKENPMEISESDEYDIYYSAEMFRILEGGA